MISAARSGWARWVATGVPLLIARLLLGGMMVYVSIGKIQNPVDFLKAVREYQLYSAEQYLLLNLTAVIIPWIELLGGVFLLLGVAVRGTGGVMLVMLISFTVAILQRTVQIMVTKQLSFWAVEFNCGCGTGVDIIWIKILENGLLLMLSVVVLFSTTWRWCLRPVLWKSTSTSPALSNQS
ncbi:MAG: hypothetical protein HJJLKODD_00776 [Phycisphaerae bacterium]|nr:hypothetical protein [Phycisphaerae bacterium]